MYYRVNGQPVVEGFDMDEHKNKNKSKPVFPIWLLLIIILVIISCGFWFLLCLRKKDGRQDFGFQFY